MVKKIDKIVVETAQLIDWLRNQADVYDKYITKEGQGFLDGFLAGGHELDFVSREEYNKLDKKCKTISKEYESYRKFSFSNIFRYD